MGIAISDTKACLLGCVPFPGHYSSQTGLIIYNNQTRIFIYLLETNNFAILLTLGNHHSDIQCTYTLFFAKC